MIAKLSTNAKIWSPWSPRNLAVSVPSLAASETLSRSGRMSSVMAIATTASVKNFSRSALSSPVDSAMRGNLPAAQVSVGHRQRQGEVVGRVGPPVHEPEAGGGELALDAFAAELGRDLGAHLLPGRE